MAAATSASGRSRKYRSTSTVRWRGGSVRERAHQLVLGVDRIRLARVAASLGGCLAGELAPAAPAAGGATSARLTRIRRA